MIYHYSVVPGLILMGNDVQILVSTVVAGFQPRGLWEHSEELQSMHFAANNFEFASCVRF